MRIIRPARPIEAHLDHRVSLVMRRGLVTTSATRRNSSTIGVAKRWVNSKELGRSAYTTRATTTATAGGSLFSPDAERRPSSRGPGWSLMSVSDTSRAYLRWLCGR